MEKQPLVMGDWLPNIVNYRPGRCLCVFRKGGCIMMIVPNSDEQVETLNTPDCIRTRVGGFLNFRNPQPNQISIVDIAFGLSRMCRFAGHTMQFYSVAQHCCDVCDLAPESLKLQALLHDASEAYIGDIAKPIKEMLPDYQALENRIMTVIAQKFDFQWPLHQMVKNIDAFYLKYEWKNAVLSDRIKPWSELEARSQFLDRFKRLIQAKSQEGGIK